MQGGWDGAPHQEIAFKGPLGIDAHDAVPQLLPALTIEMMRKDHSKSPGVCEAAAIALEPSPSDLKNLLPTLLINERRKGISPTVHKPFLSQPSSPSLQSGQKPLTCIFRTLWCPRHADLKLSCVYKLIQYCIPLRLSSRHHADHADTQDMASHSDYAKKQIDVLGCL